MKIKAMSLSILLAALLAGTTISASSATVLDTIPDLHTEFAQRYDYDESDLTIIEQQYQGLLDRIGSPERREDGTLYEAQGFYDDSMALFFNSYDMENSNVTVLINGRETDYSSESILYNGYTLVPAQVFKQLGIKMDFDESLLLTTYSSGNTVIEIQPYMLTMRKNREEGYWAPLPVCARIFNGSIYMPLRAIAEEFGIAVEWDGNTNTVALNY